MRRYAFIINPVSGTRSKDKIEKEILSQVDRRGLKAEIAWTEYAGHATELAREFARFVSSKRSVINAVNMSGYCLNKPHFV